LFVLGVEGLLAMPALKVTPIGFESLGVRSMCTYVETPDLRVLIDAGVALGPRFRLLPHPREYRARNVCRAEIRECAAKADIVVVSHYHNDHHTPNYTETVWLGCSPEESEQIYQDKIVLLKDIRNAINFSQRRRGWMFQRFVKKLGSKCEIADGQTFQFGRTKLKISDPVPHGEEESQLGWVLMTSVEYGDENMMHTSDVQGPMARGTTRVILKEKPDLIVLGGPPLYLEGVKVEKASIMKGLENAARVAARVPTVIFEHHLLRSGNSREKAEVVYDSAARANHRVISASDYLGREPQLLECNRERLYEEEPPREDFVKWTKLPRDKRSMQLPPV
jgi:predicted metallo-beta-lactamase superfamily hydrolase